MMMMMMNIRCAKHSRQHASRCDMPVAGGHELATPRCMPGRSVRAIQ